MLLTRLPLTLQFPKTSVRLACVKHAASVHPEPGSNSPLYFFKLQVSIQLLRFTCLDTSLRIYPNALSYHSSVVKVPCERAVLYHNSPLVSNLLFKTTKSADLLSAEATRDRSTNLRSLPSVSLDAPPTEKFLIPYSSCESDYTQN